jgi:hypothetical protein
MGAKRLDPEPAGCEARRVKRRALGSLKSLSVQPRTLERYEKAVEVFVSWLEATQMGWPDCAEELDETVQEFLEYLWETGRPKMLAADALSGIQYKAPYTRHKLPGSWRLYGTWTRNEPPVRAPPMSIPVLQGLCGLAYHRGEVQLAVSLLLGHHCLLRTGELTGVLKRDLQFDVAKSTVMVSLGYTKTGKRSGRREEVLCDDPGLAQLLWEVCRRLDHHAPLCGATAYGFRRKFHQLCRSTEIGRRLGYQPYSLRRGGATALWEAERNVDHLMMRGRWSSARTARQYVEESAVEFTRREISRTESKCLQDWAAHLPGY